MSAIFESLKKLDQKDQEEPPRVSEGASLYPPPKRMIIWRAAFLVLFLGFAIATFLRFRELNIALSSYQADLTSRLESLSGRIEELIKNVQTLGSDGQNTAKRLERLAGDFARERDLRNELAEKQAQLMEGHRNAVQAQLEERFSFLSRQIAYLEEEFQRNFPRR